jgi:hypothetical protein
MHWSSSHSALPPKWPTTRRTDSDYAIPAWTLSPAVKLNDLHYLFDAFFWAVVYKHGHWVAHFVRGTNTEGECLHQAKYFRLYSLFRVIFFNSIHPPAVIPVRLLVRFAESFAA